MSVCYTERVAARARLARALGAKDEAYLRERFLRPDELAEIARLGQEAKQADREQQVQKAEGAQARTESRDLAADVGRREGMLSALLPAIVADLVATSPTEAGIVAKLSFARFRTRVSEVAVEPVNDAEQEMVRRVQRVERSDRRTRAEGLAALCTTLLEREPALTALRARGMEATFLERLRADAEAVAREGSNRLAAADATAREAAAVRAQNAKWSALKHLIRRACASDPDLARQLSEC